MSFNFKAELKRGVKSLGLAVADDSYEPLEVYFNELKKWNRKVNLIAKSTADSEIVEKHFLDSLTLLPFLQRDGAHLLDIGTGEVFLGLSVKLLLVTRLLLPL